jgi:hypothetical protein
METAEYGKNAQKEPNAAKFRLGRLMLKFSQTLAAARDDGERRNRTSSNDSAPAAVFRERTRKYLAYSSRDQNLTNSRNIPRIVARPDSHACCAQTSALSTRKSTANSH